MIHRSIDIAFALVLLSAAFLKTTALVAGDRVANGIPDQPWLQGLVILLEVGLATWLLTGRAADLARRAAMSVLAAFAVISGAAFLRNDDSCGCFGAVAVAPGWVFVIDVTFFLAFFASLVSHRPQAPVGSGWACAAFGSGAAVALGSTASLTSIALLLHHVSAATNTLVVDPVYWVGTEFPLLEQLADDDERESLRIGNHVIILVSRDCASCHDYIGSVAEHSPHESANKIRLIDIAGRQRDSSFPFPQVNLRQGLRVIANVPIVIRLEQGVVRDVNYPRDASSATFAMSAKGTLMPLATVEPLDESRLSGTY